jgi:hypothetical protein
MKTLMVSLLMISLIVTFSFFAKAGPEDLVLYYAFDEGSGKTVTDLSKTGNDGAFMTDIKWVKGKYEGAIECDQDWIDSGNNKSLNITDELTLEAWVNPAGSGNRIIVVKPLQDNAWTGPYCAWDLMVTTQAAKGVEVRFDDQLCQKGDILPNGKWYHVALTYSKSDSGRVVEYLNGEVLGECSRPQELRATETKLRVASAPNISEPMQGIIDELAIYHRALSQEEIQEDMKAPIKEKLAVQPSLKLTTTWASVKRGIRISDFGFRN